MLRLILIIVVFVSFETTAVIYSKNDIQQMVHTELNKGSTQEFVRGFFTAKDPQDYIHNYLNIHKNRIEPIHLEYKFYQLLSEISHTSKQIFLQEFVTKMKSYEAQAFTLHDEGRLPVAIYNLAAKAQGIENIWIASDAHNYYIDSFEKDSISTLLELRSNFGLLKAPQWLGLKNSLKSISSENHVVIADYFLNNPKNLTGLDKFIGHYALFTGNKRLIQLALKNLDQSSSEFLLRHLKDYFDDEFVIEQLIATVDNDKNQAFAMSMMLPYLNNQRIQDSLFKSIKGDNFSNQAALVLLNTNHTQTLQDLENMYNGKDVSENTRKQIIFVMKMNKLKASDVILSRLIGSKTTLSESISESIQWLGSFKGEVK